MPSPFSDPPLSNYFLIVSRCNWVAYGPCVF